MDGKNERALLYHIMEEKKKRIFENAAKSMPGSFSDRSDDKIIQMKETRIYIGLNDPQTKEQKFETEKYMSVLKNVCQRYHVAFSVDVEQGGYYHDDGEYTEETSFVLLLIGAERDVVKEIARDLCTFFLQESVLVTENDIVGYFIDENGLK